MAQQNMTFCVLRFICDTPELSYMLSLINFEKGRAKHGHVDVPVLVSTLPSVSSPIVSFVFEKQREGRGHEVKVELIIM
jgi:hypothetical protein